MQVATVGQVEYLVHRKSRIVYVDIDSKTLRMWATSGRWSLGGQQSVIRKFGVHLLSQCSAVRSPLRAPDTSQCLSFIPNLS